MRTYWGTPTPAASTTVPHQLGQGPDRALHCVRPAHADRLRPRRARIAGEVGKVGVPVAHLGHMAPAARRDPSQDMNTSMTINGAPPGCWASMSPWPTARASPRRCLAGTTQNDIVKEYLQPGDVHLPARASLRLIVDTITFTVSHTRSGTRSTSAATTCRRPGRRPCRSSPMRLATAIGVLDGVRARAGRRGRASCGGRAGSASL